ncbi:MAG: hypothetical protein WBQ64_01480 [Terriglobales bacterium]
MRIDGSSPVPPDGPRIQTREPKPVPPPAAAPIKDQVETQPKPEVSPTNVLVEMQPGNIVVYKFIDEASGRLIQQIPSEQMLNLSKTGETAKE